jgi:hypothetical protein
VQRLAAITAKLSGSAVLWRNSAGPDDAFRKLRLADFQPLLKTLPEMIIGNL